MVVSRLAVLESLLRELQDFIKGGKYLSEYEAIERQIYSSPPPNASTGETDENMEFNRYTNLAPHNKGVVVLKDALATEKGQYVNASRIPLPNIGEKIILAQGPLIWTIEHFWRMIFFYRIRTVAMLTNVHKKRLSGCEQYWPQACGESLVFETKAVNGSFSVTLEKEEKVTNDVIKRTLTVESKDNLLGSPMEVVHFQFAGWPDYGVPSDTTPVVKMEEEFSKRLAHIKSLAEKEKESAASDAAETYDALVHCSGGVGRSGAFLLFHASVQRLRNILQGSTDNKVPALEELQHPRCLLHLRACRHNWVVQGEEQYQFSYRCLMDAMLRMREREASGSDEK